MMDENLIQRLKGGSCEVFERLFKEMSPKLYRFALTYSMDAEVAADVVQDVFVHFWTAVPTFSNDLNVNGYLYSAVKNACLNHYKHLQVEDSHKNKLTEALIYAGTLEYEDDSVLFDKVRESLQQLPDRQRKVLELKIFQGLSYREIATVMEVSEVTVHTHVKRAYKFIRESFPMLYILLFLTDDMIS